MLSQTTHISLLKRLGKRGDGSASADRGAAWNEFCDRYGDVIRGFARRQGLQPADCDDVVQDVLAALTQSMPGFTYDPAKGKFRSYLKTVTLHAIFARSRQKRGEVSLEQVCSAAERAATDDEVEALWNEQWRQYHLTRAMQAIDVEFNRADRAAFERYALDGESAEAVAKELGMSVDQVYKAKSRIIRRLTELIERQVAEEG